MKLFTPLIFTCIGEAHFWQLVAQYCGWTDGGIIGVGSELMFM
jgi:hypothetical protein